MHDPESIHDNAPATNRSGNRPFEDVLAARVGRRAMLGGTLAGAVGAMFITSPAGAAVRAVPLQDLDVDDEDLDELEHGRGRGRGRGKRGPLLDFTSIPLDASDRPTIAPEYSYEILAPWGAALSRRAPEFSYPPTSAADQENQVGIGHDGMWFFPLRRRSNDHGMLVMNHEFGTNTHVLGVDTPTTAEQVAISQAAHGCSAIEIKRDRRGRWKIVKGRRSRRITVNSPVTFSGPAADSELLANPAGNEPLGTVNNCANGYTPWGTYLTCEENFNGYFGTADPDWTPSETDDRYGFEPDGFGYGWHLFDPRFDLADADYGNERNRFGWVVEIDPTRPDRKPVKRTALGRVKHEGAAVTVGRGGRVVVYMGDDQRFDYIYKFVSDDNYRSMLRRGRSPLDHGTLYAARFDEDGTGEWLELSMNNPAVAAGFASQEEIVTYARVAADLAGATPMDRPEWTTVGPDGDVFCTLTNNTRRTEPNAANPQAPNENGHIIRWRDSNRHLGTTFEWDIWILASETTDTDFGFGSPDGLWADPDGRLFIQTDGDQPGDTNNQMLVANVDTGEIRRLFTGPAGCEITGIAVTPDQRTMFINVQHPGDGDPDVTLFPFYEGDIPRDSTVVVTRNDGGIIGS